MQQRNKSIIYMTIMAVMSVVVFAVFGVQFAFLQSSVAQAFISAIFGSIFAIVMTAFLLNKQTDIEFEKDKSQCVFNEKISLFKEIVAVVECAVSDGMLSMSELRKLQFMSVRLYMMGSDTIIHKFSSLIDVLLSSENAGSDAEFKIEVSGKILSEFSEFAIYCRQELGLGDVNVKSDIFGVIRRSVEKIEEAKSGRDYTKLQFDGVPYPKSRFVHAVMRDYVQKNPAITYDQLKEIFPDSLQGALGVFVLLDEAISHFKRTGYKRYFMEPDEILDLESAKIAVCNQWGGSIDPSKTSGNIPVFLNRCRELKIKGL